MVAVEFAKVGKAEEEAVADRKEDAEETLNEVLFEKVPLCELLSQE